jgi:hypothetical protein
MTSSSRYLHGWGSLLIAISVVVVLAKVVFSNKDQTSTVTIVKLFVSVHSCFFLSELECLENGAQLSLAYFYAHLFVKKKSVFLQLVPAILVVQIHQVQDFVFPHLHDRIRNCGTGSYFRPFAK